MSNLEQTSFDDQHSDVLNSIKIDRIILPVTIGIGVILFLLWQQFDPEEFDKVNWSNKAMFWIFMSIVFLVIRHLAYALRLRTLSQYQFSWLKSIELIFIWEFSSAVSPTSLGGSAVALFMLAQEKLSAAKTAVIVIYTIISDTLLFILSLPLLYWWLGPLIIRPGMKSLNDLDGWGITFATVFVIMSLYGAFFFYGLFFNPEQFRKILVGMGKIKFLSRFKTSFIQMGDDIVIASDEIKNENFKFHFLANLGTLLAWGSRFLILNCLIIAIVENTPTDIVSQAILYTRSNTMFLTTAFSPTPGGAGLAEIVFGGFLSDFVPVGIAILIAFIWRLITYYVYLFAGVVIIPNWIRKVLNRRKADKLTTD